MELILLANKKLELSFHDKKEENLSPLAELFYTRGPEALLKLLDLDYDPKSNDSLLFWHSFTHSCLKDFCLHDDNLEDFKKSPSDFKEVIKKSPFIAGYEHLNESVLSFFHTRILTALRKDSASYESREDFLKEHYPEWAQIGSSFFHLAENPEKNSSNFIFLATYAIRVSERKRLQHITFGKALEDSLKEKDKATALKILEPLHKVAKESVFVKTLLEEKKIYGPSILSNKEAQNFLGDFSLYEKAGIQVKLPKSWEGKKPTQPKVTLTLEEEEKKSFVSFNSLFRFHPRLTLEGKHLTEEEVSKILETEDGLIKIRGKWLDVNKDKLERVLGHWEKARLLESQGLSFVEALKLLGKSFLNLKNKSLEDDFEEILETTASEGLFNLIDSLKNTDKFEIQGFHEILKTYLQATLRPYQEEGVRWLYFLRHYELGGCLCDDMGLGKTIQVIAALLLTKHLSDSPRKTSLLITPASLLGNWATEMTKFAPSLRFKVLHPSFDVSRQEIGSLEKEASSYDVLITSYQRVEKTPWFYSFPWSFVILDEAQAIKNPESKQSKDMKSLTASCKIALTGTPIENKILDLWSLFDFSFPHLLGNLQEFKEFYQSMVRKESFEPLKNILKPYMLRRLKTDKAVIHDLPEKIEKKISCFLSETQTTLYKEEIKKLSNTLKTEEDPSKRNGLILSYLMKFKQICNHPSQYLSDNVYSEKDSGKFKELRHLAEKIAARREKLLVFTQFKEITDILDDFLRKIFGKKGFIIHGGIPPDKRKEYVEMFQKSSEYPYFVLSLKAGGSGLNLTAANHVIHFDRWWNPAVEKQASDRSFRIGQKKNVMIYKFLCKGTLEENIDAMITDKEKLTDDIIEASSLKLSELSNEEILTLVTLTSKEGEDFWK